MGSPRHTLKGHSQFLSGSLIVLGCSLLAFIAGYAVRILYARTFTPEEFGALYAVLAWLTLFSIVRNAGLAEALTYRISQGFGSRDERASLRFVLATQVVTGTVMVTGVFVFRELIGVTLIPGAGIADILLPFAIAFAIIGIPEAIVSYYRGKHRFGLVGVSEPLRTIGVALVSIILLGFAQTLLAVAFSWLVAYVIVAVIYVIAIVAIAPPEPVSLNRSLSVPSPHKDLVRYAFPSLIATVGLYVFYNIDVAIIAMVLGTRFTGLYSAALPLANLVLLATVPLAAVAFPLMASFGRHRSRQRIRTVHALGWRIAIGSSVVIAIPILLFGPSLLSTLFGQEYIEAWFALQVLVVGCVLRAAIEMDLAVIAGLGRVAVRAWMLGLTLVFNCVLTVLLVRWWGIFGAALATTTSFFVLLVATGIYLRRLGVSGVRTSLLARAAFALGGGVAIALAVSRIIPPLNGVALVLAFGTVGVLSALWSWSWGLFTFADIRFCASFLRGGSGATTHKYV